MSGKNRTNGSPGLVRKILDWPQPGQVLSRGWRCSWSSADRRCSNYIWVINRLFAYQDATYIRGLTVSLACCSPAHGNGLTQLSLLTTTSQATAATITTPNNTGPPREQGSWGQHGAHLGPIWGREDPGGPHVGPMNFAIRAITAIDGVGTDGMLNYQCLAVLLLITGVEPNPGPLNDKRPVGLYSFTADSNCGK